MPRALGFLVFFTVLMFSTMVSSTDPGVEENNNEQEHTRLAQELFKAYESHGHGFEGMATTWEIVFVNAVRDLYGYAEVSDSGTEIEILNQIRQGNSMPAAHYYQVLYVAYAHAELNGAAPDNVDSLKERFSTFMTALAFFHKPKETQSLLQSLIEDRPTDHRLVPILGELLYSTQQYEDVITTLSDYHRISADQRDPIGLFITTSLMIRAMTHLERWPEIITLLNKSAEAMGQENWQLTTATRVALHGTLKAREANSAEIIFEHLLKQAAHHPNPNYAAEIMLNAGQSSAVYALNHLAEDALKFAVPIAYRLRDNNLLAHAEFIKGFMTLIHAPYEAASHFEIARQYAAKAKNSDLIAKTLAGLASAAEHTEDQTTICSKWQEAIDFTVSVQMTEHEKTYRQSRSQFRCK